jgi:hypothetical protein
MPKRVHICRLQQMIVEPRRPSALLLARAGSI